MVTETDRNKARSAVVSAYHALDCVTIPFSFLHAFADAAVDAVSTDAEPVKTAPAVAVKAKLIADLREMAESFTYAEEPSRVMREAAAALSAQVHDVAVWQPIETADKNAPRLLLGIVRRELLEETHVGGYRWADNEDDVSCWWSDQADDEIVPTHWMPLPASKHGDAE